MVIIKLDVQICFSKHKMFGISLEQVSAQNLSGILIVIVFKMFNSLEILGWFLKIVHLSPKLSLWTSEDKNVDGHFMASAI